MKNSKSSVKNLFVLECSHRCTYSICIYVEIRGPHVSLAQCVCLHCSSLLQMNKENFRFYIKVRTALDIQPTIIHDELCTVFGDEDPSFRTVAR